MLNGYHDRAPVVIWPGDRERWMTVGADVNDLIGPESADRFDITPVEGGKAQLGPELICTG